MTQTKCDCPAYYTKDGDHFEDCELHDEKTCSICNWGEEDIDPNDSERQG